MIRRNRTMRFLSASQTRTMYVHKDEHAHSRNHIHRKANYSNTLTHPLTDTQKKRSDMLKDHIRIISALLQWPESVFGLIWLIDKTNISVESLHSVVSFWCALTLAYFSSIVALWRCKCQQNRWMERTSHQTDTCLCNHKQTRHTNTLHKYINTHTHTYICSESNMLREISQSSKWGHDAWHTHSFGVLMKPSVRIFLCLYWRHSTNTDTQLYSCRHEWSHSGD